MDHIRRLPVEQVGLHILETEAHMEILMLAVLIFVIANFGVKSKPTPVTKPIRPVAKPIRPVAVEPREKADPVRPAPYVLIEEKSQGGDFLLFFFLALVMFAILAFILWLFSIWLPLGIVAVCLLLAALAGEICSIRWMWSASPFISMRL
jgi:hypothetical protein